MFPKRDFIALYTKDLPWEECGLPNVEAKAKNFRTHSGKGKEKVCSK